MIIIQLMSKYNFRINNDYTHMVMITSLTQYLFLIHQTLTVNYASVVKIFEHWVPLSSHNLH